jgi:hypothetical protein
MMLEAALRADAFLIDRVAQPIVTRFGLRPLDASRSLLVAAALLDAANCCIQFLAGTGSIPVGIAYGFTSVMVCFLLAGWQRSTPPCSRLLLDAIVLRLSMAWLFINSVALTAASFDGSKLIATFGALSFASAYYVLACKPPPPRRRPAPITTARAAA